MLTSMLTLSEIGTSKPHFTSCMETTLLFEPHCLSQVSVPLVAKPCLRQRNHSVKKHTLQACAVQQTKMPLKHTAKSLEDGTRTLGVQVRTWS